MPVERRRLLGAMAATAAGTLATPAVAQSRVRLTASTLWPEADAGPGAMVPRLARRMDVLSGGQIQLEATQITNPGLDAYAEVARGDVSVCFANEEDWLDLNPAYGLFCGSPFGMTADEFEGWIYFGDGENVWARLAAESGVKPMLVGDMGLIPTMTDKQEQDLTALSGQTARATGFAARFWETMGVKIDAQSNTLVDDPDIGSFANSGPDMRVLSPSVSRPHYALSANFNIPAFEALSEEHKGLVQLAIRGEHMAQRIDAENAKRQVVATPAVNVSDLVSTQMALAAKELLSTIDDAGAVARDVFWSHQLHLEDARAWSEIGEGAYLTKRHGNAG
ncbi:MAG: hypothetical protein AAF367_00395 [Pseudomonadota bacterium]